MFEEMVVYADPADAPQAPQENTQTATATQNPQDAQVPPANSSAGGQGQSGPLAMIVSFLPMILIIVLLYFMMIRPQRRKEKETQKMLAALKVGDKVTSIGGICGKVSKIKDDYVYLETGSIGNPTEKSYIKMERSAIKSVEQKIEA